MVIELASAMLPMVTMAVYLFVVSVSFDCLLLRSVEHHAMVNRNLDEKMLVGSCSLVIRLF